jgi:hypothetical protein
MIIGRKRQRLEASLHPGRDGEQENETVERGDHPALRSRPNATDRDLIRLIPLLAPDSADSQLGAGRGDAAIVLRSPPGAHGPPRHGW